MFHSFDDQGCLFGRRTGHEPDQNLRFEDDRHSGKHERDADVEGDLVVDEMSTCVRGVIKSLPGNYRTALVLHDLAGLTAAQVAEVVDCSLATAKIRIHRARRRLKEALEDECWFYRDEGTVFRCDRKPSS